MTTATIIARFDDELVCSFVAGDGELEFTGRLLCSVYNTPKMVRAVCEQPMEFIGSEPKHCVPFYQKQEHYNSPIPFSAENLYWELCTGSYPDSIFVYHWDGTQWKYLQLYVNQEYEEEYSSIRKDETLTEMQRIIAVGKLMLKYMSPIPEEYHTLTEMIAVRDFVLDDFRRQECRWLQQKQ